MIGYKLVANLGEAGLASIWAQDSSRVFYEVGKPARPAFDCGPLCVFSELADAMAFSDRFTQPRNVYRVEYEPHIASEIVWVGLRTSAMLSSLAKGTRRARSVILLEKVA